MSLGKVYRKFLTQLARRRRQKQLHAKTGAAGHKRAAGAAGRAMRKLSGILYKALPGFPYWGGGRQLVAEKVRPLMAALGYSVTSQKRWETFGNPGSDHYKGNRKAYAEDYDAVNDQAAAQKLRSELDPGATHHDYETFIVEFRGHRYACQIIAGTHGTGPHLHFGCRRVD